MWPAGVGGVTSLSGAPCRVHKRTTETTYPRMPARSRVTRARLFAPRDVTTNPTMLCASGSSKRRRGLWGSGWRPALADGKRAEARSGFPCGESASSWKCRKKERDQKLGSLSTHMWVRKGWNQKGLYSLGLILTPEEINPPKFISRNRPVGQWEHHQSVINASLNSCLLVLEEPDDFHQNWISRNVTWNYSLWIPCVDTLFCHQRPC